jgi:hypothetical protein
MESRDLELVASVCRDEPALGYSSIEFASALPPDHQLSQDFNGRASKLLHSSNFTYTLA